MGGLTKDYSRLYTVHFREYGYGVHDVKDTIAMVLAAFWHGYCLGIRR